MSSREEKQAPEGPEPPPCFASRATALPLPRSWGADEPAVRPRTLPWTCAARDNCPAFRLWREHHEGDADGIGAFRGLWSVIKLLFVGGVFVGGVVFVLWAALSIVMALLPPGN